SAVSDSPHREALFSGKFLKGQWTTLSFLRAGKISFPNPGYKAVLHLRHEDELFVFVSAHEQRIKSGGTGNVTTNDELLFHVSAEKNGEAEPNGLAFPRILPVTRFP